MILCENWKRYLSYLIEKGAENCMLFITISLFVFICLFVFVLFYYHKILWIFSLAHFVAGRVDGFSISEYCTTFHYVV